LQFLGKFGHRGLSLQGVACFAFTPAACPPSGTARPQGVTASPANPGLGAEVGHWVMSRLGAFFEDCLLALGCFCFFIFHHKKKQCPNDFFSCHFFWIMDEEN
jgi:hypothetical protein